MFKKKKKKKKKKNQQHDSGWWYGEHMTTRQTGWFPSTFVKIQERNVSFIIQESTKSENANESATKIPLNSTINEKEEPSNNKKDKTDLNPTETQRETNEESKSRTTETDTEMESQSEKEAEKSIEKEKNEKKGAFQVKKDAPPTIKETSGKDIKKVQSKIVLSQKTTPPVSPRAKKIAAEIMKSQLSEKRKEKAKAAVPATTGMIMCTYFVIMYFVLQVRT